MRKAVIFLLVILSVGVAQRGATEEGVPAEGETGQAAQTETSEGTSSEEGGQQQQPAMCGGGGIMGILPIVAMVAIFYFLIIRPQQKQQKRLQSMRDALAKGDRVVTSGGIHGVVTNIKGSVLTVRIADGVKVDVEKESVTVKQGEEGS